MEPGNYDAKRTSSRLNNLRGYIRSIYFPNMYPDGSNPVFETLESARAEAVGTVGVLEAKHREVNSMIFAIYSQVSQTSSSTL